MPFLLPQDMKLSKQLFLSAVFAGMSFLQAQGQNTVFGTGTGSGGFFNTHVGAYAGNLSTAYNNSFFGHFSGRNNTTGYDNSFIGFLSGFRNTTGHSNTFLGTNSGSNNLSGDYNTFIGISGMANTTGSRNTFLGYESGRRNTSGQHNTFLGNSSGNSNIDGNYNTFVGSSSGYSNLSGHRNVYVGHYSGYQTSGGNNNVYLGHYSGYKNINGQNNVFIGYLAGFSETGSRKLYIDTGDDDNPLLYGDFTNNALSIGTKYTGTNYQLVVPGPVRAVRYDVVSDERLKENIKSLSNVLAKVQQVKGVSYFLKEGVET